MGRVCRIRAFTLIELLVVIAIISILAAILFPVFQSAKGSAKAAECLSNLKQIGLGFSMYINDHDDRMPDRRDLKALDYRPWTNWPPSDPRGGWAVAVLKPYQTDDIFTCPSARAVFQDDSHVMQVSGGEVVNYWLWRFDRTTDPVQLDNFWGKTPEQALSDLQIANNPQVGNPQGVAEVELAVDPYFPSTIPTVPVELRGKTSHGDGRNRLFLDGHAKRLSDARTRR